MTQIFMDPASVESAGGTLVDASHKMLDAGRAARRSLSIESGLPPAFVAKARALADDCSSTGYASDAYAVNGKELGVRATMMKLVGGDSAGGAGAAGAGAVAGPGGWYRPTRKATPDPWNDAARDKAHAAPGRTAAGVVGEKTGVGSGPIQRKPKGAADTPATRPATGSTVPVKGGPDTPAPRPATGGTVPVKGGPDTPATRPGTTGSAPTKRRPDVPAAGKPKTSKPVNGEVWQSPEFPDPLPNVAPPQPKRPVIPRPISYSASAASIAAGLGTA